MKHLLFKLKKDGKTIGYCKLLKYHDPLDSSRHWAGWGYSKNGTNWGQRIISFDTAHSFVTQDKHGKDVFAGDKVNRIDDDELFYKVAYHPETCQWFIENNEDSFDIEIGLSGNCEYIELIED